MEIDLTTEGAIKRGLQHDLATFFCHFSSFEHISFAEFRCKWSEMDLGLLSVIIDPETIVSCLIQNGLFSPSRPFRDHQLLVFTLFALHKSCRKPLKLSAHRIQFLLGLKMRASMLGEPETVEALEQLFGNDAFVIIADETKIASFPHKIISSNHSIVSVDQLFDRLKQIEAFLAVNPLFDHKMSRITFTRLNGLFERYYESKRNNMLQLENEQDFGAVLNGITRIVEGYERLLSRYSTTQQTTRSIRTRITQQSLTPVIPSSSNPSTISPELFTRSQSVPAIKSRRTSNLREVDLDEFIENSSSGASNMPSLNFY